MCMTDAIIMSLRLTEVQGRKLFEENAICITDALVVRNTLSPSEVVTESTRLCTYDANVLIAYAGISSYHRWLIENARLSFTIFIMDLSNLTSIVPLTETISDRWISARKTFSIENTLKLRSVCLEVVFETSLTYNRVLQSDCSRVVDFPLSEQMVCE